MKSSRDTAGNPADRAHREPADPLRTPWALDRHRIIESTAFRRLEHKTQVFTAGLHDHFRTRLTHTLEVAQIARTVTRALGGNEDLAEAIALAHDLGHPPFGHAGEKALDEAMAAAGGFNHNLHSLRVVEYLEHPYPAFRGLNLTRATRDGLRAHVTRYDAPDAVPKPASLESAIASLADRVAYSSHDLEDAIGAGYLDARTLCDVRLWREAEQAAGLDSAAAGIHATRRPILDAMLDRILRGVVDESRPAAGYGSATVTLPADLHTRVDELEQFLLDVVYRRAEIAALDAAGRAQVLGLFAAYRREPALLPQRYAARIADQGLERVIADYIAGMTDRFCSDLCTRLGLAGDKGREG